MDFKLQEGRERKTVQCILVRVLAPRGERMRGTFFFSSYTHGHIFRLRGWWGWDALYTPELVVSFSAA